MLNILDIIGITHISKAFLTNVHPIPEILQFVHKLVYIDCEHQLVHNTTLINTLCKKCLCMIFLCILLIVYNYRDTQQATEKVDKI